MTKTELGERTPLVEQCRTAGLAIVPDPKDKDRKITINVPCTRISGEHCKVYLNPETKWKYRPCPFSQEAITEEQERMLNPLKASKRAAGK